MGRKIDNVWRVVSFAPVRFVVVVAVAVVLATLVDPYLYLDSAFQAQVVNAAVPLVIVLLVWGLAGRAWFALLVELLVLGVLRYADVVKVRYLKTDLVYADFMALRSLVKEPRLVLGFLDTGPLLLLGLLAVAAVLAVWFTRKARRAGWPLRAACLAVAAAALVAATLVQAPTVIPALNWQVYSQARGAKAVGVAGNILLGKLTSVDVNRKADPAMVAAFWREPLVRQFRQQLAASGADAKPDIVIIQSESLFMPSQLNGFSDTPVLDHIVGKDAGSLEVPVFGGRTLQTEFEVQTGAPIAFYPGSMFAYYELLHHRVDALPHVLDRAGYKTVLLHPNKRGFWNRNAAIPELGFATFQDIGSFLDTDYSGRGFVSDLALMQAVLAELDASNRPAYVTAITMNNHGPWGEHAPASDVDLGLPGELTGDARREMADYIRGAKAADQAFGFLIDALKRRGRPTIVVLYGDHLPALYDVYEQLGFKDGQPPETHMPPYRVWANFPIRTPPSVLPAYLLQGLLLREAGVKLEGHVLANAIAGMVASDAAIPAGERTRILDEYANVAAANLQRVAESPDPDWRTVFVGYPGALPMLEDMARAQVVRGSLDHDEKDLVLRPDAAGVANVDFDLGQRVASVTLRPYVPCTVRNPTGSVATFAVEADGELLYRASVGPRELRLATLDTRAVKHLVLTVDAGPHADPCGVDVRVAQILKCLGACSRTPADATEAPAWIVANDPTAGDVEALAAIRNRNVKMAAPSPMANMRWLLAHEVASREGLAPIKLQSDGRLFMHPADDHSAWAEFDVADLASIELTPRINPLDETCKKLGAKAGVVGLTVDVDGKPVIDDQLVDRDYDKPLRLDVAAARTLKINVDDGNGGTWCDWFSVGVAHLDFLPADQADALGAAGGAQP